MYNISLRYINESVISGVKYIFARKLSGVLNMQRQNNYLNITYKEFTQKNIAYYCILGNVSKARIMQNI